MAQSHAAEETLFRALLTPHRSLGPKGFAILMGVLIALWMGIGVAFLAIGAWPVFGFFGLDILLVYLAFRWNYRAARAHEEVLISRSSINIRKVAPSGREEAHSFNPFWARFAVRRHELIGITGMSVEGEGRNVSVGGFLNPDDRESFASAFGRALATAKAG